MVQKEMSLSASSQILEEFDRIALQLRDNLQDLEDRVNSRTRDLQTVSDVSRRVTTHLAVDTLLPEVVELTKNRLAKQQISFCSFRLKKY